jgi:ABC-type bacteriocin/lantibiotic exporter with double-glycine peptidase domain
MDRRFLNIEVAQQTQSLFCWCAVCVSLIKYYSPTTVLDQETFSKKLLGTTSNRACHPLIPLESCGLLHAVTKSQVSFRTLKDEIDLGFPVITSLRFFVGSHLVLITGYENEQIRISDPMSGGHDMCDYSEFAAGYQNGMYNWAETYYTRPATGNIGKSPVFLASDDSSFIVGAEILSDSGMTNISRMK